MDGPSDSVYAVSSTPPTSYTYVADQVRIGRQIPNPHNPPQRIPLQTPRPRLPHKNLPPKRHQRRPWRNVSWHVTGRRMETAE